MPNGGKPAMRVFRLGNSHTNSIKEEFLGLVGAAGHRSFVHDQHTVPGAPIRWLYYKAPKDSVERLRGNPWDVVIVQTYNSTTEEEKQAIVEYTRAARRGNPDVRVILYTIWPGREYTLMPGDPPYPADLPDGRNEKWTEEVAERLRKEFPDLDVAVAPTSLVIRYVGGLADAGLIPGLRGYGDLTQDAGHMGLYGGYAIGCTFSAMIFNESPIGYPHQMLAYGRDGFTDEVVLEVKPEAALAIQRVVWDVLAKYEHDGLDTGVWISSGRLSPALVGRPYDRPIPIANAVGDPTFKVIQGKLPDGLALEDARITGTAAAESEAMFTLQARDGRKTVSREMILPVEREAPLSVVDYTRALQADEYLLDELKTKGAVGTPRWELLDGQLPSGLTLKKGGLLMGTPAEEGVFKVTVRATDRHPNRPRTAEGKATFRIGPPSRGTLVPAPMHETVDLRRPLSEQDLEAFDCDNVICDANGNEVARFHLSTYLGKGAMKKPGRFDHLTLIVKVAAAEANGIPLESVHIYMDPIHNREVIYNEDDMHYRVTRTGRRDLIQGYRPERHVRSAAEVHDDGSWAAAVTLSMGNFMGYGVHAMEMPLTYGLNVAVGSQRDPERRFYWRGDASSDTDTSVFGSIWVRE
jgi:hypothetical protein